jgi:hypothetical protein
MAIHGRKKNFYKLLTIVNSRFRGKIIFFFFSEAGFTNENLHFTNEKRMKKIGAGFNFPNGFSAYLYIK